MRTCKWLEAPLPTLPTGHVPDRTRLLRISTKTCDSMLVLRTCGQMGTVRVPVLLQFDATDSNEWEAATRQAEMAVGRVNISTAGILDLAVGGVAFLRLQNVKLTTQPSTPPRVPYEGRLQRYSAAPCSWYPAALPKPSKNLTIAWLSRRAPSTSSPQP
jgi:hypothetical protein